MSGRSPGLLSKVSIGLHFLETKTRRGRFGTVKIHKRKMRKTCSARAGGHQHDRAAYRGPSIAGSAAAGTRVLCPALHIGP